MNRAHTIAFRLLAGFLLFCWCYVGEIKARTPPQEKTANKPEQKKAEQDPFAPEPAPPLPAGMTGSDPNAPRAKLTPGVYDAGEIAKGLKHLQLLKKPDQFQLDSAQPD